MPLFILIRHGENDYVKKGRMAGRLPGVHLNKKGLQQAQALANMLAPRLKEAPEKVIYSSPLERAVETAEPLAKALGLEVIQRDGLIETNIGEWTGETLKSLRRLKIWRTVQASPSLFRFPGGETFATGQLRIVEELQTLAARHDPKTVIILVSHSDPIKLALAYFLGMPLDCFQRLSISPASLSTLFIGDGGVSVMNINVTSIPETPRP